ncbi:BTAD domain-containing putative transcriptional regulator [Bacillus sp. FJAT-22090]|uniref:BTAD domain-containing putative transcriptional regulator n=1 Tax=Bacillus sp. FJAT-22090 TaxID=1581038 RepID=UPI0016432BEC|nr:BTAD domain-containing putative transcriptional regulator [Bacillus sp. FJAT-22090]
MIQPTIIMSKLTPPIASSFYMRRSSLIKKLKTSSRNKLSLLHSGAGFGKSSALAQYYSDSREKFSWYTITEEDDDILPFLNYLVQSIKKVIPTFGKSLMDSDLLSMYPKEAELTHWYSLFSNELSILEEPFCIVLDDYHLVDHVFSINYIVEKIIEFLPPKVHLIVASRIRPKWSILLKMKLNGQLTEIIEADFMFSEEEIQVFFEDYFDKIISLEEASEIMRLTEGWAIAIHLLAMQVAETNKQITQFFDPALKDLFSYLSEEVFSFMSPEDQQSLLNFSIFQLFNVKEIQDFFGKVEAEKLDRLSTSNAFIQRLSETNAYRFHALFQQFLEDKWIQKDISVYYDNHKKAANYFKEKNNIVQAIHHAVKTKDEIFLGEIVISFAGNMIKAGQFDWLLDLLKDHFSIEARKQFYELYYFEGECHRYRAFYEKARRSYKACLKRATENQDIQFVSRSNAGIAHIYLDTIQPALAKGYLEEAVKWADKSEEIHQSERLFLKRLLVENLVNLGRANDARKLVTQEQLEAAVIKEGNLDARILLRTVQLNEAQHVLENRMKDEKGLPDSHRETEVLLSFIYSLSGQMEKAIHSANKGIEMGIREKSGFVEAVGWIRKGHAEFLANPLDLECPETYYMKAIQRMDELSVSRAKAEPYMGLAMIKSRQGRLQEAISYGKKGLQETNTGNDYWLSAYILLCLTIVYFEHEQFEQAIQVGSEAIGHFISGGDVYGEMIANYWLMCICSRLGIEEDQIRHAQRFADICVQHNFHFFVQSRTIFGPADLQMNLPLIQKICFKQSNDIHLHQIATTLSIDTSITYPGYQLNLRLLGSFVLFMGRKEVDERKWQRDKSKELLTYLYLQKNRFVPKEELMRALWGENDEKTMDRDFKVTLNSLLKVIEPNRVAREDSYFVIRKQSMYRLNPKAVIESDLETFMKLAEKGRDEHNPTLCKDLLLKAVKLYEGELLENKTTIDWILHEREKARQQYVLVLERLAQTSTRLKEFDRTIYWAEQLLKKDPTWEEAYRLLMFAFYQKQNRSQAVKWYERCVAVLEDELNIEPMNTTIQMYEMIISHG